MVKLLKGAKASGKKLLLLAVRLVGSAAFIKIELVIQFIEHLTNGMLMDVNTVWFNVKTIARFTDDVLYKIREDGNIY